MAWTALSDALPSEAVLICVDGEYYLAVLVDADGEAAFMDVHSSDLLPWPSHWMSLPPPPNEALLGSPSTENIDL